jgi:DNA-directed RNA polymerase subunit RPC12/RpoP
MTPRDDQDESKETRGLECPDCGCRHLPVAYTRQGRNYVQRVRYCRYCGKRIVTRERRE